MKNNLEYYQHYANSDQHPKFKTLRVKYGWQGEGRFWALNNRIAQSDNCALDLSKERNRASIASDLGLSLIKFNEFVEYLSSESCALLKNLGDNLYTTDVLQENLREVNGNREAGRLRQEKLRRERLKSISNAFPDANNALQIQEQSISNGVTGGQSKVKESKEKETKTSTAPAAITVNENFEDFEQYLLQSWGRDGRPGLFVLQDFIKLGQKYGREKLYEAIHTAAQANVKNFRYVKGILERQESENKKIGSTVQQDHGKLFVDFFCECKEYSTTFRRMNLEKNINNSVRCDKCGRTYPVKSIIEKAGETGKADFINYEHEAIA